MPHWILPFVFGIVTLLSLRGLPSLWWLVFLLPTILLSLCLHRRHKIWLQLAAFLLGFTWTLLYAAVVMSWSLPHELEGKNLTITGQIASLPVYVRQDINFEFKIATMESRQVNTKIKLNWYSAPNGTKLIIGDTWQLVVRLKRPHGVLNPGGFDLERNMFVQHLRAKGYVVAHANNSRLASQWYHSPIGRFRTAMITQIKTTLAGDSLTAIILACVAGFNGEISPQDWSMMRETGTSYLVAIAGLHIGLVAEVMLFLVQLLWRCSKRLPLLLPAPEAGILVGLLFGLIYAILSGLSIPTQRSLVMLCSFSLLTLLRRKNHSWQAWWWSLFIVLLINPLSLLTLGFWLSFMAVAAILYVVSQRLGPRDNWWQSLWKLQFTVTLALLPLTLFFFQQFSLTSLLANIVAMPMVCFIVIPLALLGSLLLLSHCLLGNWFLLASSKILHVVWQWLAFWAHHGISSWYHSCPNQWILLIATLGILLLLAPRGFLSRPLGLIWLAPLFLWSQERPTQRGEIWFTLLDVGQGLAALVQTKSHLLLYDTGPSYFESNAGTNILIPYLRQLGLRQIDLLLISHGDSDHSGGARPLLQTLPIKQIITSTPQVVHPYPANSCQNGQRWQWDGVDFQMLSPSYDDGLNGNNGSCVLKVTSGKNSLLLTGDIEKLAERLLIYNHGSKLKSTILVAPHHGSKTSSTKDFIRLVAPQYVLFPTGYRNRFRFPNKKIVARYASLEAICYNVPTTGALTFKFDPKSDILSPRAYREEIRKFWHDH